MIDSAFARWGASIFRIAALVLSATMLALSAAASAHLLPKEDATMKLVENSANFVVAVPVSAFDNVDRDANGLLSPDELNQGKAAIKRQFLAKFTVSDETAGKARPAMTWILPPETGHGNGNESAEGSDYVVVMHRVFFDRTVRQPMIVTHLFGNRPGEGVLSLRATRQIADVDAVMLSEEAKLSAGSNQHVFFARRATD